MTRRLVWLGLWLALAALAQQESANPDAQARESEHFREMMAVAGSSPVEFIRGMEEHLRLFPDSDQRDTIERSIVKAALQVGDRKRIIEYGSRRIEKDDATLEVMQRVTRALLESDTEDDARKALGYAKQYEAALRELRVPDDAGPAQRIQFELRSEEHMGKALVYQARATGNLGDLEQAAALAQHAYEVAPMAEAARESARWLARLGRAEEALRWYADAFTIRDPANTAALVEGDRAKLRELWLANHDSEAGLGDLVLTAYDRTTQVIAARRSALKTRYPNFDVDDPMNFVLSGVNGEKIELSSLRGKVVVFDFWATWCGPCRAQQPLYEQVKGRFRDRSDVVFLNVNTDQDRTVVAPFLRENQWEKTIWFEDGLQHLLEIYSIPATIIVDKDGHISSRMNGFAPDKFVDMLTARIQDALEE